MGGPSGSFSSSEVSTTSFRGMLDVLMVVVKRKLNCLVSPRSETGKKKKLKSYDQEIIRTDPSLMPGRYKCPCGADLPTLKGLRSHQSQSRECRAWATRAKAAVSASSSEDEVSEGPSHSEPTSPPVESIQLSDDNLETDNINISSPLPPDPLVIQDSDDESIPTASSQKRKHHYVHVEDDEEVEPPEADLVYIQEFPAQFRAGWKKEEVETQFEILREKQKAEGQEPWFPFPSKDEWELARWLMKSVASQSKINSFMKLKTVRV
jgi:hypothetical protein